MHVQRYQTQRSITGGGVRLVEAPPRQVPLAPSVVQLDVVQLAGCAKQECPICLVGVFDHFRCFIRFSRLYSPVVDILLMKHGTKYSTL